MYFSRLRIFTLMIYQWGSDNHSVAHFASIVGFYFDCLVLLQLLSFTLIVGFCVDCWDLFKLWKFCIILVELENKFWIGKYIAEYTMMRQMKPQILFKPRHTEKWTHFYTNHDHHEDGWVPVGTGAYRWVLASTGGYWRVPVGTSGRWLSLSITLLQT